MTFNAYLQEHVCYRRLIQSMPQIDSPFHAALLSRYERGVMPSTHPFARQMRKLEYLTRTFRRFYDASSRSLTGAPSVCSVHECGSCIINGGF